MFNKFSSNKPSQTAITSIIGEDAIINGDLNSSSSIRIDGKVNGNISAQKLIIVGEKAEITGNLTTHCVIMFGKLNGNIIAAETQLKKTGMVDGDLATQTIEVEKGGKCNGNLVMTDQKLNKNTKEIPLKEVNV